MVNVCLQEDYLPVVFDPVPKKTLKQQQVLSMAMEAMDRTWSLQSRIVVRRRNRKRNRCTGRINHIIDFSIARSLHLMFQLEVKEKLLLT